MHQSRSMPPPVRAGSTPPGLSAGSGASATRHAGHIAPRTWRAPNRPRWSTRLRQRTEHRQDRPRHGHAQAIAVPRHPGRVVAAASIYGVRLIEDQSDSPHRTLRWSSAEIYVGWAEFDQYAPLDQLEALRAAFAGVPTDLRPRLRQSWARQTESPRSHHLLRQGRSSNQ